MSLNYELRKIHNYEELLVPKGTPEHPMGGPCPGDPALMLRTLIFATMTVGMGSIKNEAEAIEFYSRISFYEKVRGACRTKRGGYLVNGTDTAATFAEAREIAERYLPAIVSIEEVDGFFPIYFTLDEVKRCIGLTTNVGKKSDAVFLKKIFGNYASDVKRAASEGK